MQGKSLWGKAAISFQDHDPNETRGDELLRLVIGSASNEDIQELLDDILQNPSDHDKPHLKPDEYITSWTGADATVQVVVAIFSGAATSVVSSALNHVLTRKKETKLLPQGEAILKAKQFIKTEYMVEIEKISVQQYREEDGLNIVVFADTQREYTVKLQTTKRTSKTTAAISWKLR